MKIELSRYVNNRKDCPSEFVKEYNHIGKEYSMKFGEYELIFIPKSKKDIESLKKRFLDIFDPFSHPNMTVILKKDNKIILKGKYAYREFAEEGPLKGAIEIHIESKDPFKIYLMPESQENLEQIFDKIFPN